MTSALRACVTRGSHFTIFIRACWRHRIVCDGPSLVPFAACSISSCLNCKSACGMPMRTTFFSTGMGTGTSRTLATVFRRCTSLNALVRGTGAMRLPCCCYHSMVQTSNTSSRLRLAISMIGLAKFWMVEELDDLARTRSWIRNLVSEVRCQPASTFLEPDFYKRLAKDLPNQVLMPAVAISASCLIRWMGSLRKSVHRASRPC
jgi:hypothetical protein